MPCEHTSDDTRRQGAITRAGPAHARHLLVEATHHYRRPPRLGVALERRQTGADPRVCAVAWRAQQRLYRQWQRLHVHRRKPSGIVVVACARELSAFMWEAATVA
jgi:transposase